MKKFNAISALTLCLMLVFSLAGCQQTEQTSSSMTDKQTETTVAESTSEDATTEEASSSETTSEASDIMSAEDLMAAAEAEDTVVVDARGMDTYSGWDIEGKGMGGHIMGATDFAAQWLTSEYDDEKNLEAMSRDEVLAEAMENKGITADKKVIVYDVDDASAMAVAEYFKAHGIEDVDTVNISDMSDLTMVSYPQFKRIMPPSKVAAIASGEDEAYADKHVVIVDVRWGSSEESGYADGHIPTAVHVNTDSFEPPVVDDNGNQEWMLADDETLAKLVLENGITKDTTVIATSPEPMAAFRFGLICEYLGVNDVHVLSGGMVNWNAQGLALEKGINEPTAASEFGAEYPVNKFLIKTQDEAAQMLENGTGQLCDIRTWKEHIGEDTGYSYHNKAGRIEGAIFAHAGKNTSYSMYYYRNIDKTMRNADEIMAMWTEDGIDVSKHMSHMCGSGWRAAESMVYALVAGLDDQSLYSDGWIGWSNDGRPSVTGEPQE